MATSKAPSLLGRIGEELRRLEEAGARPVHHVLERSQHARGVIAGREVVSLASNNYLGFANHPFLKERARQFLETWGVGAGSVRNIAGSFTIHEELERKLAAFKGVESVTVFQSGFTTNQGVLGALLREGDLVVSDALNHASIIDGLRLTKATRAVYAHADADDLDRILSATPCEGMKVVATDGVFSMDGDIAPLDRIVAVARKHGAIVYLDDAHGSGVLGAGGRGTADHFGLHGESNLIQIGTLSKAWGAVGGYAAGPRGLNELLRASARPMLFSTSPPPAVVGALIAAIELIEREPAIIDVLWRNAGYFRSGIQALGFDTLGSQTPIVPVGFGEAETAHRASELLLQEGIFAVGIGYPVVPRGKARIRNIITAEHTVDDLDKALEAYARVGKALGVI